MKVSIIVPIYNEEESLLLLESALKRLFLKITKYEFEVILVNDGSRDRSLEIIKQIRERDRRFRYISFSRNFGKEAAMLAGLNFASGQVVGIMDADLQHSPDMIPQMLAAVVEEGYDVAASRRAQRDPHGGAYNSWANLFYKVINRFSQDIRIEDGAQDFRFMRRPVVEALLALPEKDRFSKGLFAWVGFETKWFEAQDRPRLAGQSTWSFGKSLHYALDGILSFSALPLRISFVIGGFFALIGMIYAVIIIIRTLFMGSDVPGYPSLISAILIMGGLNLLFLGVIGEYVARIYKESKNRPNYIIDEESEGS